MIIGWFKSHSDWNEKSIITAISGSWVSVAVREFAYSDRAALWAIRIP